MAKYCGQDRVIDMSFAKPDNKKNFLLVESLLAGLDRLAKLISHNAFSVSARCRKKSAVILRQMLKKPSAVNLAR